ncbi:MAG: ubiquitin carboxyl-terminal hydrolase [Proteobacteria bacterium]|nr:ubiquitin carboxyl-terminal hydrolase [Pseudomonadota bacterium]NBP13242.1 ubiquitin carboxyl-terminal hydrolase [bacterium]
MYEYDMHKHYQLVLAKGAYSKKGLSGFVNQGNTCFMNSILQCLSNTLKLTDYFLSGKYKEDDPEQMNKRKKEYFLVLSWINLLNNVWETNQILHPKSFFENLANFKPKYYKLQQQDSHECLGFILEILHKGLCYPITVEIKGTVKTRTDALMKKSLEQFKTFYENEYSAIIETFYGMLYNSVTCNSCNKTDDVFEPFNCLGLQVPQNNTSIYNCLDLSFGVPEIISSWKCEGCKKSGCVKTMSLWSVPNFVIIQFKRFSGGFSVSKKVDTHIDFPLEDLDLTKYISNLRGDPNNYLYDCYAINYHNGDLDGGHYWSACRNVNNCWYLFNDANVSKVTDTNILTKNAYLLFYQRKMIPSATKDV